MFSVFTPASARPSPAPHTTLGKTPEIAPPLLDGTCSVLIPSDSLPSRFLFASAPAGGPKGRLPPHNTFRLTIRPLNCRAPGAPPAPLTSPCPWLRSLCCPDPASPLATASPPSCLCQRPRCAGLGATSLVGWRGRGVGTGSPGLTSRQHSDFLLWILVHGTRSDSADPT